jgi:aldoxime dehydratase
MDLQSAVPAHLRRTRSRSTRVGDDYVPRGVAYAPLFPESTTRLAVAYLGLQHPARQWETQSDLATSWLRNALAGDDGPAVIDSTQFVDTRGWINPMFICYWQDVARHRAWWDRIGHRWTRDEHLFGDIGRFAEVFSPAIDRVEGILSDGPREGLALLAGAIAGPIREHGYWGSMRDRIPLAQTDELSTDGGFSIATDGSLTRISAPGNLAVIRTGQDWNGASTEESACYLDMIEPTVKVSLEFMNHMGVEIGCLCSRYARFIDRAGMPTSKAINASIWLNLARLEHWAGSHWTHLASYASMTRHSMRFGAEMRLSRYHEVLVPATDQVVLEYRNCHRDTGLCAVASALDSEHRSSSNR